MAQALGHANKGEYKLSVLKMRQEYKKLPTLKFTKETGTPTLPLASVQANAIWKIKFLVLKEFIST